MTVDIMYYDKKYNKKPVGYEIIEIQKNLKQTKINIKDLAEGLSNGATFKPANLNGTKSKDFISQQLFALDFDCGTTIERELLRCEEIGVLPVLGYTSFSHTEKQHRFRLIFCNDKVISDVNIRNKLQCTLINLFPNSDSVTKDSARIFFGGKALIYADYNNFINGNEIIQKHYKEPCNSSIASLMLNKKKKVITPKENNDNIKLIQEMNIEKLKKLLNISDEKHTFKSDIDVYNYINSLDLSEYLSIGDKVNCIFPEHSDTTPSANIYYTDDGTPIYKCFGCGKAYTIIAVTEKLANCSRSKAIDFIKQVYNIELIKSDWTTKQKQLMIDSANYLDTDEFKLSHPKLSTLIRTRKKHIQAMLMYFTQYVNEDLQVDGKPFFFASYKTLLKVCQINPNKRTTLAESLVLFALLNMVVKMQIVDIPENQLLKAKSIATKYRLKKLTNFYQFEEYGINSLAQAEEIAKILKENNVTLKGISREYILRTFNKEIADKVYPQYKYENECGTSEKSDNLTIEISIKLLNIIDNQGYCLESDIKGNGYSETQWKKSIQEILNTYGLKRVKATKIIKQQNNIPNNIPYQSYVLVKSV